MSKRHLLPLLLGTLGIVGGCKPFDVKLGTDKPLKVDIKMKLDVYQHEPKDAAKKTDANVSENPESARRSRLGEIQALKNSRLVGENRSGLLAIRNQPVGEYGDYVKKTVAAENADRGKLMEKLAKERGVPLAEIEKSQAALFRQSSFTGEWCEEPESSGGFLWKQKN